MPDTEGDGRSRTREPRARPGRAAMTGVISTTRLTKEYGATHAVTDLDLEVDAGQVFGFLGPNGAGKTTTIRMLLALQRPTRGQAKVLGLDPGRDAVLVHRRVGYLPGDLALYPRLTGQAHIDWFRRARGGDADDADELIERFAVVTNRPVRELSKGNRQKIGLVLAFMHRPELLILDEPTAGLDPLMQREFLTLIREVAAQGRTVFLSSHELDEVQRAADRVAIIKSGRLVAADSVDGLRRAAPQKIDVTFPHPVDLEPFSRLPGVTVTAHEGARLSLEIAGAIGPALRLIASHDPVDLISRHADLDELFLSFYRDTDAGDS